MVHQFVPGLLARDAVGHHTLETQRALVAAGIAGGLWAGTVHSRFAQQARPYEEFRAASDGRRLLLYQCSSAGNALIDLLLAAPDRKTLCYHNITPAEFWTPYDPAVAATLTNAREGLHRLAAQVRVAIADSEFSAQELRTLGIADVRVIPPYLPPPLNRSPDPTHLAWLERNGMGLNLLSVGRFGPNEGHAHLLRAFAGLRAAVDPKARLFLVGAWGPERYMRDLFRLRRRLGVEGVTFTGPVSEGALAAHYRAADVFLGLSEHEGFGRFLIEAMRSGVPIIAYDSGAASETLAGTGVLVRTVTPALLAEVIGRVGGDQGLRAELSARQRAGAEALERVPRDALIVDALIAAAI